MIGYTTEYNKKDFEYNTNLLINNNIDINNIIPQDLFLNSDNMNISLETIESNLDKLYEKTRIIQDLSKYAKYYIEQNIHDITAECKSIINSIETDRDKIKSFEYNTIPVTLLDKPELHNDRNGENLFSCELENNKLIPSGKEEEKIKIKSIEKIKGFTPYRNNVEELSTGKQYRSFYLMDGPGTNGLKEELLITLEKPSIANSLKIKTSNCKIESVSYVDVNDNKIMIKNFNGHINSKELIKQIIISINCDKYKQKSYAIDIKRIQDNNFWDKVKEEKYREELGIHSIYDLEKLSGIKDNEKDYNDFSNSIKQWENKYIKYKINHNEWEERKKFFDSLKDTIIKGEEDWNDIEVSSDNKQIKTADIFKNGKLNNSSIKLAKKDANGKIKYIDISNMTEKQINNYLATDPNIFLVNTSTNQKQESSPLKYSKNILSNLYALNNLINKGIYPSLKQVLMVNKDDYNSYAAELSLKASRILNIVYYKSDNPYKIQALVDETEGVGLAIVGKYDDIDYKYSVILSKEEALKIIRKANEISGD